MECFDAFDNLKLASTVNYSYQEAKGPPKHLFGSTALKHSVTMFV